MMKGRAYRAYPSPTKRRQWPEGSGRASGPAAGMCRSSTTRSLFGTIFIGILVYLNAVLLQQFVVYRGSGAFLQHTDSTWDEDVVRDQESFAQAFIHHNFDMEKGCSSLNFWKTCTNSDFNDSIVIGNGITSVEKFITIAVEVRRPDGKSLESTLTSILESSTRGERNMATIVIYLGEQINRSVGGFIVQRLRRLFQDHLEDGFFQVVQSPMTSDYEIHVDSAFSSTGHVRYHAKSDTNGSDSLPPQNDSVGVNRARSHRIRIFDLAYLFNFYQNIPHSGHFMLISDDAELEKGFLTSIQNYVRQHQNKFWISLDFATIGFFGKLYQRENLKKLQEFCMFFATHRGQPIDMLYQYYNDLRMQRHIFLREPSIFRRLSSNRSLILDRSVLPQGPANNPPASIYSTMEPFSKEHLPAAAYKQGSKYFYGKFPKRGDEIVMIFDNPTTVKGLLIVTGITNFPRRAEGSIRDIILDGKVEISPRVVNRSTPIPECEDYRAIGYSVFGTFAVGHIEEHYQESVACVRILVLQTQVQWIAVNDISVWS